jgi:hypothetical protein
MVGRGHAAARRRPAPQARRVRAGAPRRDCRWRRWPPAGAARPDRPAPASRRRHDQPLSPWRTSSRLAGRSDSMRHAAVGHRFQHRHRDRIAGRQRQVPLGAVVPAGLRGGVQAADELHPAGQAQPSTWAAASARSEPSLATTRRNRAQAAAMAAKTCSTRRVVDRLQPAVGEHQVGSLADGAGGRPPGRRETPSPRRRPAPACGRPSPASRWWSARRRAAPAASASASSGLRAGRDQDVAAPGRADQPPRHAQPRCASQASVPCDVR